MSCLVYHRAPGSGTKPTAGQELNTLPLCGLFDMVA